MDKPIKNLIQFIREQQNLNQVVLKEELQGNNETLAAIDEPVIPPTDDEIIEDGEILDDPNLLPDPILDLETNTIEQKKIMLIEYFKKLFDKIHIVKRHIDTLSFDSAVFDNAAIGATHLQFNLEGLHDKVSTYIEDQYESDKYERSLYVYLSFMEELKLIVRLIYRQVIKQEKTK